jgi:pyrroline-5-carboxylate reductase
MSLGHLTIGFIGGGNMAHAIAGGLLRAGHPAAKLVVADPAVEQRRRMAALGAIRGTDSNPEAAGAADILVLAVKPQVMPAVLAELAGAARPPGQLVISIAAGVRLERLTRAFGAGTAVVRAMPNQPALIGEGMTVLTAAPSVSAVQRKQATYVATATGRALWIGGESLMDAVTAVSGSGPAYFYMLMEIMEDAATGLGLPADAAREMVRQTALGAARLAIDPAADVKELRAAVTSPGGTTAAALAVLEQAGIRAIVSRAIVAARDRGAELGRDPG